MSRNERAFPAPPSTLQDMRGMTLRDYFAAAALTGMAGNANPAFEGVSIANQARDAYRYADAMLAEREKD